MKFWKKRNRGKPDELVVLACRGVFPSFSDETYLYLADKIYTALEGFGTDVTLIQRAFNCLQNDADFIKLNIAFGFRIDPYPIGLDSLLSDRPRSLTWFLMNDLSSLEIAKINRDLREKSITKLLEK